MKRTRDVSFTGFVQLGPCNAKNVFDVDRIPHGTKVEIQVATNNSTEWYKPVPIGAAVKYDVSGLSYGASPKYHVKVPYEVLKKNVIGIVFNVIEF